MGDVGPRQRQLSRRAVLRLVSIGLVALAGCADDDGGALDAPDAFGPFGVGYTSYVAVDPARGGREVSVGVWYPIDPADLAAATGAGSATPARYPILPFVFLDAIVAVEGPPVSARPGQSLLVFSHGYEAIAEQSLVLVETLASHGFVVAAPEHAGNSQFDGGDDFDVAAANRVPDVSLVVDTLLARSGDPGDAFAGRLDPGRVGVVGHSFGGMTAIGSAAGWAGAPPDPRVAAIAPISAVVDGELQRDDRPSPNAGFSPERLASIRVPVLLLGGTEDRNVPIENNALAFAQMTAAPVVYEVDVIGANHTHFADICRFGDLLIGFGLGPLLWPVIGAEDLVDPYRRTCGPDAFPIAEASRLQNLYVVSFFRRHLRGERAYEPFLGDERAAAEPAISLSVRREPPG